MARRTATRAGGRPIFMRRRIGVSGGPDRRLLVGHQVQLGLGLVRGAQGIDDVVVIMRRIGRSPGHFAHWFNADMAARSALELGPQQLVDLARVGLAL